MTFGFTAWLLGTITVLFIVLIRFYINTRNANLREEAERENELRETNRRVEEYRRQLQQEATMSALKQRLKTNSENRAKAAIIQPTEKSSTPRRKPNRKVPAASAVVTPSSTTAPKKPKPRTPRKPRSVTK